MGRAPCCEKVGLNKGTWTEEEDLKLIAYVRKYGHHNWRALPKLAGLSRCGKSCRLRWINYLRPDIKRGNFTSEEEETVIKLHALLGNKWSKIASCLPGRTDNEIKNVWNTHLKKRVAAERAMAANASNSHFSSSPSPSSSSSSSDQCLGKRDVIEIPVDPSIDMFAMLDDAVRLTGGVEEEEEEEKLNALSGEFSFSEGVSGMGLDEIELQMPPVAALMEGDASKELVHCLELEEEEQQLPLGLLGGTSEVRRSVVPGDFCPWDEMEGAAMSSYFQMFDFDFDLSPSPLDAFDLCMP